LEGRVRLIAEEIYDLAGTDTKMAARLYAPVWKDGAHAWSCAYEIGAPLSLAGHVAGVSSLEALVGALRALSVGLYGSAEYRNERLGSYGSFGGGLGVPAVAAMLDEAPYPF
jgi:hypothetical protein